MGDETYVSLSFPEWAKELVDSHLATQSYRPHDNCAEVGLCHYGFGGVPSGELPFLNWLADQGIPYDSVWEGTGDFGVGSEYFRCDSDGLPQYISVYDTEISVPPATLYAVLAAHLNDPIACVAAIRTTLDAHMKATVPLPWDNQEDYSKIYRTKKLLGII